MTGLDLVRDALIEVAVLVTDGDLNVLGEGVDLVIRPPAEATEQMSDVVRRMHTTSGLIDQLIVGVTLEYANGRVLSYIREHVPEPGRAPLAGNTVHMDRLFLARDLPEAESWLHYRNVDVSSIDELRYYRRTVFVPLPGPDTATSRVAAASIGDDIDADPRSPLAHEQP